MAPGCNLSRPCPRATWQVLFRRICHCWGKLFLSICSHPHWIRTIHLNGMPSMNHFENHHGISKWHSECIFVFLTLNHWSHCICLILMYNITSWITENHDKLAKMDLKQCCYSSSEANRTGFNLWLWFDIPQTTKPSKNMHGIIVCEVICWFLFCTNQDVRWPSFTIHVAVKSLFSQALFWVDIYLWWTLEVYNDIV